MDVISQLAAGLQVALQPEALLFCFIGVTIGTFVGVLPGVGSLATISMALPITYYLDPTIALIMLAGIYYGGQYGSSVSAILLNIPGAAAAAVTCLDGFPMTRQGRAGVALFLTTIASFFAGSAAIVLIMVFAPILAEVALRFGAPEYFAVMLLGLVGASTLGIGSPIKGLAMVCVGLLLSFIGTDVSSGDFRFTFGQVQLMDGVDIVAIAMGLFGVGEILSSIGQKHTTLVDPRSVTLRSMLPTRDDIRRSIMPTMRGTAIGTGMGVLPGSGPTISTFMAYALEQKVSRDPLRFGKGAVEGVVAPEAANNAAVQAGFIPTLSLGLPGDATMAVLLGAMMIHGITPGPQFITSHPDIFWGLVGSFWIGNILLVILNIPLIGVWVRLLAIPYRVLAPTMLFLICIGVYTVNFSLFDVYTAILFGVIGYCLNAVKMPVAPLLLGFVLGPMIEDNFRRSMILSRGDYMIFLQHPISAALLAITSILVLLAVGKPLLLALRNRRSTGSRV